MFCLCVCLYTTVCLAPEEARLEGRMLDSLGLDLGIFMSQRVLEIGLRSSKRAAVFLTTEPHTFTTYPLV